MEQIWLSTSAGARWCTRMRTCMFSSMMIKEKCTVVVVNNGKMTGMRARRRPSTRRRVVMPPRVGRSSHTSVLCRCRSSLDFLITIERLYTIQRAREESARIADKVLFLRCSGHAIKRSHSAGVTTLLSRRVQSGSRAKLLTTLPHDRTSCRTMTCLSLAHSPPSRR
jgi:hypothetical protein